MKKITISITFLILFIYSSTLRAQTNPDAFITTWNTENPGISDDSSIRIPTVIGENYNYTVDWGDGTVETISTDFPPTHSYVTPGVVTISITGDFPRIDTTDDPLSNNNDNDKLLTIEQWGTIVWSSMARAFWGAVNLDVLATDVPDLSNVSSTSNMFTYCANLKGNESFNDWDMSQVTSIRAMFSYAISFNTDLNNWTTDQVTNMTSVFSNCTIFNGDVSSWDTGLVTNMVTMFWGASAFNADISAWHTGLVTNMDSMFWDASSFNADISNWDTSSVTTMGAMFWGASAFNADISAWDTSRVTDMSRMFSLAEAFNADISGWDTGLVTDMFLMFVGAGNFNADIGSWDTSSVIIMSFMFVEASSFNVDISNWDTSSVTTMSRMFRNAIAFDQNLGQWDISSLDRADDMFEGVSLSTVNYDALLNGWSTLDPGEAQIPLNVEFSGGNSNFCLGEQGRDTLTGLGWTITDGGLDCSSLSIGENTLPENRFTFSNPIKDLFIVESSSEIASVQLYNLLGTLVASTKGSKLEVNTLNAGVYIAIISTMDDQTSTFKVIKN